MLMGLLQSKMKIYQILLGVLVLLLLFEKYERFKFMDNNVTKGDPGSRKIMEIEEKDKNTSYNNNDVLNVKY